MITQVFKKKKSHRSQLFTSKNELRKNVSQINKSLSIFPEEKINNLPILVQKYKIKQKIKHKKCLTQGKYQNSQSPNFLKQQNNLGLKQLKKKIKQICLPLLQAKNKKQQLLNEFNQFVQFYQNLWKEVSQSNKQQINKQMCQYIKRLKYSQILMQIWRWCIKQKSNERQYKVQQILKCYQVPYQNLLQQMTKMGNMILYVISANKKNRWSQLKDKIQKQQIKKNKIIEEIAVNLKKTTLNTRYDITKTVKAIDWKVKAENFKYQNWFQNSIKFFKQNGVRCQLLKRQIYNYY